MCGHPVTGSIQQRTNLIFIGQAPGIHEEEFQKPFAYTAGKTLFKWFAFIGLDEETVRTKTNLSAVCRCFPGKQKTGDRKPNAKEIENCREYLEFEFQYHKPKLVVPIGKLAIDQIISNKKYKLDDVVGQIFDGELFGLKFKWIALPHPSGLNVWNNTLRGKELTSKSLKLIRENLQWNIE